MTDSASDRIYAYPRLSTTDLWFMRLGGDGLGNLLFNWARCLSAAHRHGWRMIWPTWFSYKPKNWRVNPYDVRTYYDLFSATDRYVTGAGKAWCLLRYPKIAEGAVAENDLAEAISPGSVVVFRGMKRLFTPFLHDHAMILRELLAITRRQHLRGWRAERRAPIAIHVRRGDFITTLACRKPSSAPTVCCRWIGISAHCGRCGRRPEPKCLPGCSRMDGMTNWQT